MAIPIIGDIIGAVVGKAGDLASEFIVDKDKKAQLLYELERLKVEEAGKAEQRLHDELVGQMEINKVEAAHRSIFVAGWRPFIGWVSGAGVAWTFVLAPFTEFVARLIGWTGSMPELDTGQLMTLVLAMLGVGAMRSYDKVKGTANDETFKTPIKPPIDLVPEVLKKTIPESPPW